MDRARDAPDATERVTRAVPPRAARRQFRPGRIGQCQRLGEGDPGLGDRPAVGDGHRRLDRGGRRQHGRSRTRHGRRRSLAPDPQGTRAAGHHGGGREADRGDHEAVHRLQRRGVRQGGRRLAERRLAERGGGDWGWDPDRGRERDVQSTMPDPGLERPVENVRVLEPAPTPAMAAAVAGTDCKGSGACFSDAVRGRSGWPTRRDGAGAIPSKPSMAPRRSTSPGPARVITWVNRRSHRPKGRGVPTAGTAPPRWRWPPPPRRDPAEAGPAPCGVPARRSGSGAPVINWANSDPVRFEASTTRDARAPYPELVEAR